MSARGRHCPGWRSWNGRQTGPAFLLPGLDMKGRQPRPTGVLSRFSYYLSFCGETEAPSGNLAQLPLPRKNEARTPRPPGESHRPRTPSPPTPALQSIPHCHGNCLKGPCCPARGGEVDSVGSVWAALEAAQGLRVWSQADAVPAPPAPPPPPGPGTCSKAHLKSHGFGSGPRSCPCPGTCLLATAAPPLPPPPRLLRLLLQPWPPSVPLLLRSHVPGQPPGLASRPHAHSAGARMPRRAARSQRQVGRPVALPSLWGAQEVKLWEGWGAGGVLQEAQVWPQDRTRAGMAGGKGRGSLSPSHRASGQPALLSASCYGS